MAAPGRGPLRIAIEDFLSTFRMGQILSDWNKVILDKLEDENIKLYARVVTWMGLDGRLPTAYTPAVFGAMVKTSQSGFFVSLMGIFGLLIGGFMGIGQPSAKAISYYMDGFLRTFRPPPAELWNLLRRYPNLKPEFELIMRDMGVPDVLQEAYGKATEQALNAAQLEALRLRGLLEETKYSEEMTIQGYTSERIEQVQDLARLIPNPQDLVRMAVREAWNEEIVSRFAYDADFPSEFAEWMTKQGYSADWAKKYWRAHWEIPSVQAGYEMLHRLRPGETENEFTTEDIETMLKTADVPEFFRKRLIEISYSPYTRVDVRRMYGAGVLSADEVYKAYCDLGYNDERAKNLTAFTTTIEKAEEKGLTKDAAIGGYKRGIIERSKAISMLAELGYTSDDAEFWLSLVDYDLAAQLTDEKLKAIQYQYVNGLLDESTVNDKLGPLNLPAERQTTLLSLWTAQRDSKIQMPSKSELETFYERGLIDEVKFVEFLRVDGYRKDVIPMYLQTLNLELAEKAKREAERATKEAERLLKLKAATVLQRYKAVTDAEIASISVDIANLRVALFDIEEIEQKTAIKKSIVEAQAQIAQLHLEVANASIPPVTV